MGSTDGSAGRQAGRQACMQQQKQAGGEREEEEGERTRCSVEAHAATGGSKVRWV
jgi:hypothetical protein